MELDPVWVRKIIDQDMAPVPHYVCSRCSCLVALDSAAPHGIWHERIEAVLSSVEHADALAAELRERGDG